MTLPRRAIRVYVRNYHGENRATWECDRGHRWEAPLFPRRRKHLMPCEEGLRMLARWWRKGAGGCTGMECPNCTAGLP